MSLVTEQWEFLKQIAKLPSYIESKGLLATMGDAWRNSQKYPCPHCSEPVSYQDLLIAGGVSWTSTSRHLSRLALDLNFFNKDLTLCTNRAIIADIGAYWESLDPKNVHGLSRGDDGRDIYHFERHV